MITNERCISELEKLQKEKIKKSIKQQIKLKIEENNDVNSIIENIEIEFSDHKKYENLSCEILYEHLAIGKMLAQLALNTFKQSYDRCEISFPKTKVHETYQNYYETIKQKEVNENFIIDRISYYITIFSLLSYKEFNEKCRFCDGRLSINKLKCSTCDGSIYNELEIENTKRKSDESTDLCSYCDSEIINGICQICGGKSNCLKTISQKTNEGKDRSVQMRTNSSKTSSNSKVKSNLSSSQWTCNVCSYIQNNSSNINCEVCLSSKFAKINSCAFDSLTEASNENEIASVKNVENIFIDHDANNIDYKDKWTCTQCTFNNKLTVDLCEICFVPNVKKIGTMDDFELPEETWCCKRCGENNLFECYKCKNCRVPAEFFNKWRCGQCSYYNDKVAKHCEACEIENPYLMKCNLCAKNLVNKKYDKICKKCRNLTEICTNKETVNYRDNGKIKSKISDIENESDKRNQRNTKNANQNNSKNKVSQNVRKRSQDSIVDRNINNEETDNSKTDNLVNKTPSETTKFYKSIHARDENSGNPEESNIKSMNNVSQNVEKRSQDSIVDRNINNEETGNSKTDNLVNKTPSETTKFYKSIHARDENSGNPEESNIKLMNNVSQNVGKKHKFSSVGGVSNYGKSDNLTIHKGDKTQTERSEFNKSLSKEDRNSGKLNENQTKSNEDNQRKTGHKKTIPPVVKEINKKISKPCKNCKSKVCVNNQYWCTKCENSQWYCQNEACAGINFQNEYCKQCTAKIGSNFSNCTNFWVIKDCKEVQMWQCEFCLQFNAGRSKKCNNCKNHRNLPNYIKCKCNWNNLTIREKCDKCNADLKKIVRL